MTRSILAGFLATIATLTVQAETPAPKTAEDTRSARITEAARQAWTITDLVLEKDIDPPARQQMLLHALKALLRQDKGKTPANLAERISAVTTLEQFAALLAEVWPADGVQGADERRETILFNGLFGWQTSDEFTSFYLSPRDLKRHEMFAGNRYVGTGIQIRKSAKENLPQIVTPFPGGPARKAGARPGDLIVEVDGKSMEGVPLSQVVEHLQGEEGTKVSMTVRQPGESKTRLLPMVRSIVLFSSLHGYRRTGEESWSFRVDPKSAIGYLSCDEIKSSTLSELRQIEPRLQAEGVQALVLDLRFTRGSDLRHAALVADALLDGGPLWHVRDSRGHVKEYKADRDCLFRGTPLVVLIGEHTGHMAALVAAALQDRGRAALVGQIPKTELIVTSLIHLPHERGALMLRTGRIERNEWAPVTEQQRLAAAAHRLLPDHLVAIQPKESEAVLIWRQQQQSPEPKADAQPPSDPQLHKAIDLLRASLAEREKQDEK